MARIFNGSQSGEGKSLFLSVRDTYTTYYKQWHINYTDIMTSSRIDKYSEKATSVESNLHPQRKTAAILTDSKGDYLSRHVNNIVETDILWWTKKGCTTERGAKWLVENFNKKKKDHGHLCIYVWLGTCDFTEKGRKYVSLRHNLEECFNNLTSNLKELSKFAETKNST